MKKVIKPTMAILTAFAIIFVCFIPSLINKRNIKTVYADEVTSNYIYRGSNLFIPFFGYTTDDSADLVDIPVGVNQVAFNLNASSGATVIAPNFKLFYKDISDGIGSGDDSNRFLVDTNVGFSISSDFSTNLLYTVAINTIPIKSVPNSIGRLYTLQSRDRQQFSVPIPEFLCHFYLSCSSHDFNSGVTKIVIGSYQNHDLIDTTLTYYQPYGYDGINFIQFFDTNDNWFMAQFPTRNAVNLVGFEDVPMFLSSRTYLTNLYFETNGAVQDAENLGFQNGLNQGYINGVNDTLPQVEQARENGYNDGYTIGKNAGFQLGVESANKYSFLNLFTSIVDAPVQVFSKMFEFDILGMNMRTLYLSLFTLCMVVMFIKRIL